MTSNSTTPDSPKCPTCGSTYPNKRLRIDGNRLKKFCADPFHTSLPTAEPRTGKMLDRIEEDFAVADNDPQWAAHPSETRAGEQEGTGDRSPKDYAIEHGGYLADAAEAYLKQRNIYDEKENSSLGADTADNDVLGDHIGALQSCIYEFRKRAKRAVAPDQTGEGSTPQVSALTKRIRKNQEGIDVKEVLENPTAVMFSGGGSTGPDTPTEDILGAGEFAPMAKCSTCRENYVVAEGAVCTACATASVQGETLSDPPYRCRCSHELIRHGVRGGFPFCLDCDCKGFESIAPTLSDRINALPEWARQHIHDIETKCDPAGDIRTIAELRDNVAAQAAEIAEMNRSLQTEIRSREHTRDWYARHYGKLEEWARKNLPEPYVHDFFCCIANGSSSVYDSDYFRVDTAEGQLILDQTRRAEDAELRSEDLASQLKTAQRELGELGALRAGARTGMLKFMLAGDVGCFADRMRNLLQAKDWDAMRLCVTDFFNAARDITEVGRQEIEQEHVRAEAAETLVGELRTALQDAIGYVEGKNFGGNSYSSY